MSEQEPQPDEPEAPKSDHDLLVEIRDLLKQILTATIDVVAHR